MLHTVSERRLIVTVVLFSEGVHGTRRKGHFVNAALQPSVPLRNNNLLREVTRGGAVHRRRVIAIDVVLDCQLLGKGGKVRSQLTWDAPSKVVKGSIVPVVVLLLWGIWM